MPDPQGAAAAASTTAPWLMPYLITGGFTLAAALGGTALGGWISAKTTEQNTRNARDLQQQRFDRDARAVRLSTIAALRDLVQYAEAAATLAHFNLDLWEPSISTLVARVTEPETVHGFADNEWHLVATAASEGRLGLVRLGGLSANPFLQDLNRRNALVDGSQRHYVSTIREVGVRLYERLAAALRLLGEELPDIEQGGIMDLVDHFRRPLGQRPMMETAQNPDGMYVHREADA
jgi:hypothetical protein